MIGIWAIDGATDTATTRTAVAKLVRDAKETSANVTAYEHQDAEGGLKQPHFLLVAENPRAVAKVAPRELKILASGAFETTGALPQPSKLEQLNGLLMGLTDCVSPEQLDAFNLWYEHTHAADVLRSPFYWRARRFQRSNGDLPEYLAMYDTVQAEPDAFQQYLSWPERNATMSEACLVRHVWTFNRIGEAS